MPEKGHHVIVGGGHAAAQAALTLRQAGFAGRVTVIGEEPRLPYQRPPLSKAFLTGDLDLARLTLRPATLYARQDITVRTGVRAVSIDRGARRVELSDDTSARYDRLLIATGATARRLPVPGGSLEHVHRLRTAADAIRLHTQLVPGKRLVIVGGGYTGLEVAAVAVRIGLTVTVLEAADTLLARVTSPEVAHFFADVHRRAGVDIRTSALTTALTPGTEGTVTITCADGSELEADLVVAAIGVTPNISLAADAGLPCDDGIAVDELGRTADERIFAAGDCASYPSALAPGRVRLESVHNAVESARTAAAAMCGVIRPYSEAPRFWSHQYKHKLQTLGLARGHDATVLRGDPGAGSFAVLYLHERRVIAIDAVNAPGELAAARSLVAEQRRYPEETQT